MIDYLDTLFHYINDHDWIICLILWISGFTLAVLFNGWLLVFGVIICILGNFILYVTGW